MENAKRLEKALEDIRKGRVSGVYALPDNRGVVITVVTNLHTELTEYRNVFLAVEPDEIEGETLPEDYMEFYVTHDEVWWELLKAGWKWPE